MGAQLGTKGVMAEMNLTPLIDIVLVVLIIMMVNIPIQIEEMGVKLPSSQQVESKNDVPPDQLVIAIYKDGTLALNRRLTTEDVLFYETTRRLRPMEPKNVFIDADPSVTYGQVVDMMDLARQAGASRVGLARLKPDGPAVPTSVAPGSMPRGVDVGLASIVGPVSQKDADDKLKPLVPMLMGCYQQALARQNDLSGRSFLQVDIAPNGSLMNADVVNPNYKDAQLDECVKGVATQKLHFDSIGEQKTAVVRYPLLFSPG